MTTNPLNSSIHYRRKMAKSFNGLPKIEEFDFKPGRVVAGKFEIVAKLGEGWEGEVYTVREKNTKIIRAAKFFFPHRNIRGRTSTKYAKKLHKLRDCPILIQYHTQEQITVRKNQVLFLVSDYVEGELLSDFLKRQRGKRISVFQGVHLLHSLAKGLESIHAHHEYHGDLHAENIIISRHGLSFDLQLFDLFHWGRASKENIQDDICDSIRIFYDAIGSHKFYASHPQEVKEICCGLKRSLILSKFRTATKLKQHLERMHWS